MSSFSMLMMSIFYIFNPSQGKYLSIDAEGKASLSASPTPIEFTETTDGTGRYDDNKSKLTWIIKANDKGTASSGATSAASNHQPYTIGYHLADAYATGFLYAHDGIAITYAEPDANFQDGIWQLLTEEDIQTEEVTLSEENTNYVAPSLDKPYTKVNFTRKFAKNAWNSLCVPFPITQVQLEQQFGEGAKVAVYKDFDNTRKVLRFEYAEAVEAGKPCLLYPTAIREDKTYTFDGIASSSWDKSSTPTTITKDNQPSYHATYANIGKAPMGSYIFGGDNKMYHVDSDVTMKGFRGYFMYESSGSAKQLTWGFADTPTDIEIIPGTANASVNKGDIYQMDGKLVKRKAATTEGLRPGVYIMNGMKVIVK